MSEKYAPIKSLGQHFLINKGLCERIFNLINPNASDNIIEIGPGPGALSSFLAKGPHARQLFLERDRRFANLLKQRWPNKQIILIDALTFAWQKLSAGWLIAGNLPYNIASPLIWEILSSYTRFKRIVFMVQQEVAERICAKPGSRNYGALSVWCQCHASITYKLKVSPGSFSPPPKVYSAVLLFTPLSENLLLKNRHELKIILDLFFQKRRKQLGSIIRSSSFPVLLQFLEDMNINLELRPENLDPEQYQYLANKLAEWRKTQKK